MLAPVSRSYSAPQGRFPRVTHPCATKAEAFVRLACVRHAASVRSEPGSNSQVEVPVAAVHAHQKQVQRRPLSNDLDPEQVDCLATVLLRRTKDTLNDTVSSDPNRITKHRRLRIPSRNHSLFKDPGDPKLDRVYLPPDPKIWPDKAGIRFFKIRARR